MNERPSGPWRPERIVKPRKPKPTPSLPIIAVAHDSLLIERTGELYPRTELPGILLVEQPSIIAVVRAADMLRQIDRVLDHDPKWQFRVTPLKQTKWTPNRERKVVHLETVVTLLGWSGESKRRGRFHHPLDPSTFTGAGTLRRFQPEGDELAALLAWATDLREWCAGQQLSLRPTAGGLAAQLLRDPRFFPTARRKVPRLVNEKVRPRLPGNYYKLFVNTNRTHDAFYLDQSGAHHECALGITFPHPDDIHARGKYHQDEREQGKSRLWAKPNGSRFDRILSGHGLFLLRVTIPHLRPGTFPPPFMERPGVQDVFVYSNELPTLRELGGLVEGVIAAWTGYKVEHGLHAYARWAKRELGITSEERKRWLKPTLLAPYGITAALPRQLEIGYKTAKYSQPRVYSTGPGLLHVQAKIGKGERESPLVNALIRGMIEAETRKRSLDLARWLHTMGCDILAVYADSVFVHDNGTPLPLIPSPWRIAQRLTGLSFFTPTHFASREMERLPGVPREGLLRVQRLSMFRAALESSNRAKAVVNS